jgi:hypothetical protein
MWAQSRRATTKKQKIKNFSSFLLEIKKKLYICIKITKYGWNKNEKRGKYNRIKP